MYLRLVTAGSLQCSLRLSRCWNCCFSHSSPFPFWPSTYKIWVYE